MAWSKPRVRVSKPEPYDHVTWCPLCGVELWVTRGQRMITPNEIEYIDKAVKKHLAVYHGLRYGLWMALGRRMSRPFRWLITGLGR